MMLEEPAMAQSEQAGLLRRIHDATKRMVDMVQNLLDVNAIERGELTLSLTACELSGLLHSVVETFQTRAAAKGQTLHFQSEDALVTVVADPMLTVQVLENLMTFVGANRPVAPTLIPSPASVPSHSGWMGRQFPPDPLSPGVSIRRPRRHPRL